MRAYKMKSLVADGDADVHERLQDVEYISQKEEASHLQDDSVTKRCSVASRRSKHNFEEDSHIQPRVPVRRLGIL